MNFRIKITHSNRKEMVALKRKEIDEVYSVIYGESTKLNEEYFNILNNTFDELFNPRDKGELKILIKSKLITKSEIEGVISLLHDDYRDLGTKITITSNPLWGLANLFNIGLDSFKQRIKSLRQSFSSGGMYRTFKNDIVIFDRWTKKMTRDQQKLVITFLFLHEIRHAWQHKYKFKKYYSSDYKNVNEKGYASQPIEIDANKFAVRMLNKNKERINEILGIETKCWEAVHNGFK